MLYFTLILALVGQLVTAYKKQQIALSEASTNFSGQLYQKIALNEPNIVYSPYSIHSVLTMISEGARGETSAQIKDSLSITSLGDTVHAVYKELIKLLNSFKEVTIHTGNALYVKQDLHILPAFLENSTKYYNAKVDNINLSAKGGPERPINDYIAQKTKNVIKDVLSPGDIKPDTALLVVNTLFFNGTWENSFNPELTTKEDFHLLDNTVKQIDMMHDNRSLRIKKDNLNGLDVAEISFKGNRFTLIIVLPHQMDSLTDLETSLAQPHKVDEICTGLDHVDVQLAIPKFKIETSLDLIPALKALGIEDAFEPGVADFSGITPTGMSVCHNIIYYLIIDLSCPVYLSQVVHKAVIDVQETGTVAAAVTVAKVTITSEPVNLQPEEKFIVDHPFIYFLRDRQTGQILFQGKFSG
ncbi:serpin B6-like [Biomphalaria glabrata]|uniref:Serpin B6-like n=1 Tax=Biomphalaria glabrata TaxID=6526 RepID=A0A9W2YEZ7_BIOGL|nr:serpin B6-like [Biomphalaria glabrata]